MNWSRIFTVARWEYMQKVRSKAFILSLILTPLIIVSFGVLPTLLVDKEPDSTKAVGLIDSSGTLFGKLKARIESTEKLKSGEPAYVVEHYLQRGLKVDAAIAKTD